MKLSHFVVACLCKTFQPKYFGNMSVTVAVACGALTTRQVSVWVYSKPGTVGTFKIRGTDVASSLEAALSAGYRSIDTAAVYRNENLIGSCLTELLKKYSITREEIFITSKLGPKYHGSERCHAAVMQSLNLLGLDYLDLFLIHWPGAQGMQPEDPRNKDLRRESWLCMEQLYRDGKLKAIGVSNYCVHHLEELLGYSSIIPAVLQVEYHPHLVQTEVKEFCEKQNIHLQAYSSLGTSSEDNQLLKDPVVLNMALRYRKTAAQILLKWAVQQHIGVLPKSINPKHITENFQIFDFEITTEDMKLLQSLNKGLHYCWNPNKVA